MRERKPWCICVPMTAASARVLSRRARQIGVRRGVLARAILLVAMGLMTAPERASAAKGRAS